jgi:hypothetical protein
MVKRTKDRATRTQLKIGGELRKSKMSILIMLHLKYFFYIKFMITGIWYVYKSISFFKRDVHGYLILVFDIIIFKADILQDIGK